MFDADPVIIAGTLGKDGIRLVWTFLQLNLNTTSDWRLGWAKVGPSAIGAFRQYPGGDFQTQGLPQVCASAGD